MSTARSPFSGFNALAVAAIATVALVAGLWVGGAIKPAESPPLTLERATVLGAQARPVTDFSLIDHHGKPFVSKSLRHRWSVLFFGYTFCPDICPVTLSSVRQAIESLTPELRAKLNVVFVSVDPSRDTPERLSEYVTYFHPDFVGVTGTQDQLARLARGLGIVYARAKRSSDDPNYLVDHSASMLLVGPDAKLHAVLSAPHEPALLARNLKAILQRFDPS